MKNKKKKLLIVSVLLAFLFIFSFLTFKNSNADVLKIDEFSDSFSDLSINDSWVKSEDAKLNTENKSLIFEALDVNSYLGQVTFSNYKMTGPCKVEFESYYESGNGWAAFSCGNSQIGIGMPYSSIAFIYAENYCHAFISDGTFIKANEAYVQYFSPVYKECLNRTVKSTYVFNPTDVGGIYNIDYTLTFSDTNEVFGSCSYNGIIINNGYFAFNASFLKYAITSFTIYENDEVVYSKSDFGDSSILYPSKGDKNAEFVVAQDFDETTLKIGTISKLDVTKPNSYIMYKTPYSRALSNEISELYTLSVDVFPSSMDPLVQTGFEFGKDSEKATGSFAGITKIDNEVYLISYNQKEFKTIKVPYSNLDYETLTLTVNYNQTATISLKDISLTFDILKEEGYFSLTTKDLYNLNTNNKGSLLDNFSFSYSTYNNTLSKDLSINFEGIKTVYYDAINDYMSDYYLNHQDWYKTDDVIYPWYTPDNPNNYLIFSCGDLNSEFGPNYKYTDFICRFDITFSKTPDPIGEAPIIGLVFGKQNIGDSLGQVKYLGIQQFKEKSYLYANNCTLTNGATLDAIYSDPYGANVENIFIEDKTYNFMYICQNGNMKLYFKESTQDDSVLNILRGEVENVESEGYVSVFGMSYASFMLDNFSIINLDNGIKSSEHDVDGLNTYRTDFNVDKEIKGFNTNNASISKKLTINKNGYIETENPISNSILRFKTASLKGSLTYELGELKVIFSEDGSSIKAIYNNKYREFKLDEKINFDGALIEIKKIGSALEIKYVNKDNPSSFIKNNTFKLICDNIFESKLKLYSNKGTLELENISLFDLSSDVKIERRDYDINKDYINPWPVRTSIQSLNKKGCKSIVSVSFISLIILFVSIILSIKIVNERRRNYEK